MSFPFFDDTHETTPAPRLRVIDTTPEPRRTPQYRITTRGKVVLWLIWFIVAYHLSPLAEFWWTRF